MDQKTEATSVADTEIIIVAHPTTGAMKKATVDKVRSKNSEVALVDGATINWDFLTGNIARVTLGGNRTLNVTNMQNGDCGIIRVRQDATGERTLSLPGNLESGLQFSTEADEEDILAFVYSQGTFFWTYSNFGTITGGTGYDTDAEAFFTAAGITNPTQKDAVDDLVIALKAAGIWSKMSAVYPFVGGTADTHKYNLKSPLDTNGAFRLTYTGTITHNSNGIKGDGATAYAETHWNPSVQASISSGHMSLYLRTQINETRADAGVAASGQGGFTLFSRNASNNLQGYLGFPVLTSANSDSTRLFVLTRESATSFKAFRDNTQIGSTLTTSNAQIVNNSVLLMAEKSNGTPSSFSTKNIAFASLGVALSDAEVGALTTAVNAFQTALGRNV